MREENSGLTNGSEENIAAITLTEEALDLAQAGSYAGKKQKRKLILLASGLALLALLLGLIAYKPISFGQAGALIAENITAEFFLYMLGGFLAQMVDGALGMAYGLTSTTFLLTVGVPPAAASASVGLAFTCNYWQSGGYNMRLGPLE